LVAFRRGSRVEGRSPERATLLKTSRPRIRRRILSFASDVPDVRRVGPWWVTTAQTWEESPVSGTQEGRSRRGESSRRVVETSSGVVVGSRRRDETTVELPLFCPPQTDLGANRRGSRVPSGTSDFVSGNTSRPRIWRIFHLGRTNRHRRGSRVPSGRRSDFVSGNTSRPRIWRIFRLGRDVRTYG